MKRWISPEEIDFKQFTTEQLDALSGDIHRERMRRKDCAEKKAMRLAAAAQPLGDKTIAFICPEHGDSAKYIPQDHEAYCLDREEVLDLTNQSVRAAIKKAYQKERA